MLKKHVQDILRRDPFIPVRIHTVDGKKFNIPFADVAHLIGYGVVVLKGLKKGTHQADGYETVHFDYIERIVDLKQKPMRRRKAS